MAVPIIKAAQDSSIFFKIPLELRMMIYVLLLVSDFPIQIEFSTARPSLKLSRSCLCVPAGSAAILRTCRQIFQEAESILYRSNAFYFPRPGNDLGQFLAGIGRKPYASIRSIALQYPVGSRHTIDLLMGCQGLKQLCIVGDFGKTPKSSLPYWEGLRVQSVKFSRHCQYISNLPRLGGALASHYLGTFSSDYFLKIKPLGDWYEGQLSKSSQRFKELATGHDGRTTAQDRRATEARDCKLERFGRSEAFLKRHPKWLIGNKELRGLEVRL